MERWFCARTKINIPWDVTIDQLRQQEFTAWMPIVRSQTFHLGKKIIVESPLFGPYLFIEFNMSMQRWRAINFTQGIVRLLPTHAEVPEPVAAGFVEALQGQPTIAAVENLITAKFAADDVVRLIAGAFVGRFAKVLSSHRLSTRVRIEAFAGREVTAMVRTGDLAQA
jgi:transcription antitermination factor NusG